MPPTDPNRRLREQQKRADDFFRVLFCGAFGVTAILIIAAAAARVLG